MNTRAKISADRTSSGNLKKAGEKKFLRRSHQKMKKARAKKSAAEKDEKKAMKQLRDAEKKLEKASLNKSKAEEAVKKKAASRQVAIDVFEAAKADYHALKDLAKGGRSSTKTQTRSAAKKAVSTPKKVASVKKTRVKKAST